MKQTFEALMRVKGHTDFTMKGNRYTNSNLQTRWQYFQLGWEMSKMNKEKKA